MKLGKHEFARLIAHIQAIASNKNNLDAYDIENIDDLIDFNVPAPEKVFVSIANVDDMLKSIADGRKIDAIKAYRHLTGAGLKESKDAIEAYWLRQPAPADQKNATLGDVLRDAST